MADLVGQNDPVVLGAAPLAPSAMVTRLAVSDMPAWQLALSLLGLILTVYLVIKMAGKFFQSGNLLSSASFSYQRLMAGIKGKPKAT